MRPQFPLRPDYEPREFALVLAPASKPRHWRFYGRSEGVMSVPAYTEDGHVMPTFKTRAAARSWARQNNVPPYGEWSGQAKRYRYLDAGTYRAMSIKREG